MRKLSYLSGLFCLLLLASCGGGSSDSGVLIQGTLTEAAGGHRLLKHEAGERIESIEVCTLGECSLTDSEGQWGITADDSFAGGVIEITVFGHGIDAALSVDIPASAKDVFLDLQHLEDGSVKAEHITIDGEPSHHEDDEHAHE